eukprot:Amastigsp_a4147_12.p3 type:complete len:166 gc:universal Amastigsp_a4147_12:846-1343(+)
MTLTLRTRACAWWSCESEPPRRPERSASDAPDSAAPSPVVSSPPFEVRFGDAILETTFVDDVCPSSPSSSPSSSSSSPPLAALDAYSWAALAAPESLVPPDRRERDEAFFFRFLFRDDDDCVGPPTRLPRLLRFASTSSFDGITIWLRSHASSGTQPSKRLLKSL